MQLYRLKLRPVAPWATPWQSDTLAGLLCWACARTGGEAALRVEILDPARADQPPFVLSDAFPGDLLPVPVVVRLRAWPAAERKNVKRARWLSPAVFQAARSGAHLAASDLLDGDAFVPCDRLRNTLSRTGSTTAGISGGGSDGGSLFTSEEICLNTKSALIKQTPYLSVYARIAPDFKARLTELFNELAFYGYGADASTGTGHFDILGDWEPMDWLAGDDNAGAGIMALSTFQPAPHDPTDGCWDAFTKYGKIGPDFGLANVFKRPLVLLRPGASFRAAPRPFLGRAIAMHELLAPQDCAALEAQNAHIVHWAYGLAVPFAFV